MRLIDQGGFRFLPAEADIAARPQTHACHDDVDKGKHRCQRLRIVVQVPHRGTEAQAVVQHDALIDEHGRAEGNQQRQNAPVAAVGVGHAQQEKRREQVALMHLDAEDIQQDEQDAAAQRKILDFPAADEQRQHQHKRVRHRRDAKVREA